jgi:hypothetical protein
LRDYVKSVKLLIFTGDCDDYAVALSQQAFLDHREIGLYTKLVYRDYRLVQAHMMNFAVVKNRVYQIEPQTGNVGPLDGWDVRVD